MKILPECKPEEVRLEHVAVGIERFMERFVPSGARDLFDFLSYDISQMNKSKPLTSIFSKPRGGKDRTSCWYDDQNFLIESYSNDVQNVVGVNPGPNKRGYTIYREDKRKRLKLELKPWTNPENSSLGSVGLRLTLNDLDAKKIYERNLVGVILRGEREDLLSYDFDTVEKLTTSLSPYEALLILDYLANDVLKLE